MRIRLVVGFALSAVGLSAYGCSSSTNPYPDYNAYCKAYANTLCKIASSCQFDPGVCESYQSTQCETHAQAAIGAGRQYNQGAVQPCLDALNAAYGGSSTTVSASTIATYTATCDKVFGGTSGHHAACTVDSDCTTNGDVCAAAPGSNNKTCVTPTPKQIGDACADPGDQCPASAYCAPQSGTSTCVAAATAGQTCNPTTPCAGGFHCVNGACSALAGQGQPCSATSDCSQSGTALYCDTYTDQQTPTTACVTALTFARGSVDCVGIEGQGTTGTGGDAGGPSNGSADGGDAGGSSSGGGDAAGGG
jgi:hypothetical protein